MIESENVCFEQEEHVYTVDGRRVLSVTQILQYAGYIGYAGINPAILAHAAWRGTLVHEATAHMDRGVDVYSAFDLPEEIIPYVSAYEKFVREFEFIPEVDQVERPRVVTIHGIEYAMTPDAVGLVRGIPTVIERKCTAAVHPSWGVQMAAYEAGIKRPSGYRNYQRIAVQLKPDATFKPHLFEDPSDFDYFAHAHGTTAWKLNNRLIKIAA
jgi:hypothetical protein